MVITQELFNLWCSSAQNPIGDYGIFNSIEGHIISAKAVLKSILGQDLYGLLTDEVLDDPEDRLHDVAFCAIQFVCFTAYKHAIPHLDLVLSPTGFGVVSNQNVAPASAERVQRLLQEVTHRADEALDSLLDSLRGVEEWHDTAVAKKYFATLIWSGQQLRYCGYPTPTRSNLTELSAAINQAHRQLCNLVSSEQVYVWLDHVRHRLDDEDDQIAIDLALTYMYRIIDHYSEANINCSKNALLRYLDKNIESFPIYRDSTAYEANHFDNYKNQKDDSCFFFG